MDYAKIDKSGVYSIIKNTPSQIREASRLGMDIVVNKDIDNIIIAGMGGSGLPGVILQAYLGSKIPIFVSRDYKLPDFVNKRSLVFVISYSGNTEETLSALKHAMKIDTQIVVISSGGKIREIATKHKIPFIRVPSGLPPRNAYGFQTIPVLNVLMNSKIIEDKSADIKKTIEILDKPIFEDRARDLAAKMSGKIPIIYSSERMMGVAYKWKTDINELSKRHAFCNVLPEMNHNEIVAFTKIIGDFYVVIIKDEADTPQIKKRMSITKDIIKGKRVDLTEIAITGDCFLARIFSAICIGDWTSYYLAVEEGIDPTPTEIIDYLKSEMANR